MAILDEYGLSVRRQPDILAELRNSYLQRISSEIVFDDATFFGEDTVILSEQIANLEQGIQAVYNSFDVTKAEGVSLDRLVEIVGVYRLGAKYTVGVQRFTGKNGSSVQQGTLVENPSTGDRFTVDTNSTISVAECRYGIFKVATVLDSTVYQITINDNIFNYNSGVGATAASIAAGIISLVNAPTNRKWLASLVDLENIKIETIVDDNVFLSAITYLEPTNASIYTNVTCVNAGYIRAPANGVTKLISPLAGVTSTTNDVEYTTGRDRETNAELRLRTKQSLSIAGSATVEALYSAISNITGVTSVEVYQNTTMSTVDGRPPKSYECIVIGGLNDDIANAIWLDGPAGIEAFGNTYEVITDSRGVEHSIGFSRPSAVHVAVKVTATTYTEETQPTDIATLIKNAVVEYGTTFRNGEDVIAKRFYGPVYGAGVGLDDVIVETQVLANAGDTPSGSWTTTNISIATNELASISFSDVYVVVT